MIRVIGPKDPADPKALNVTSSSRNWARDFSPFFLGPVKLYGVFEAKNVENGWQYSKVYKQHLDENGEPSAEYWAWAKNGWAKDHAVRYPMGQGAIPEYSLWNGKKYGYLDARKNIYLPLYAEAVYNRKRLFKRLVEFYRRENQITLFDYDGYDYLRRGMTLQEVMNYETLKMGHAFVLAMMLEDEVQK